MEYKIITEKRSNDWIAYVEKSAIWECGWTEEEAVGKLFISLKTYSDTLRIVVLNN